MSELGQTRHFDRAPITSGLPLTADLVRPVRLVRFVPTGDIDDTTPSPYTNSALIRDS
jgi:hypothetical protein